MTIKITIAGTVFPITLSQDLDQGDIDILGMTFANEQDAKEAWGMLTEDWDAQIKKAAMGKRTPAVWLTVADGVGWWMSKEFLLATGNTGDAKLVKEEKYAMPYTEFISKCSKLVRLECQNYLAKLLETKTQRVQKVQEVVKPSANRLFVTGKKIDAVNFMLDELKKNEGGTVVKAKWLPDFIQAPVKQTTAENLMLEVEKNTLFISFKREFYMNNREGCQKALEVIKTSCRGTKLEYGKMVAGRLPIKVRGTWKPSEI